MQKLARELQIGDVVYIKREWTKPEKIRQISKRSTSGGCVVSVWIEGRELLWKSFRGSRKIQVIKTSDRDTATNDTKQD